MPLRVIPVLDVKAGRAVHAVGGQRDHYGPVRSLLHASSDPVLLAQAYRDRLGLTSLYLADLDAIAGAPPNLLLYGHLLALGVDLWLDAGIRDAAMLGPLLPLGIPTIIAGLESVRSPSALELIIDRADPERIAFSLDLRDGRPVCAPGSNAWPEDPLSICRLARRLGVRRLILLDLARMGRASGTGTLGLMESILSEFPDIEMTLGGGIASIADLTALSQTRASAVLIATALHNGQIDANALSEFGTPSGNE
jgi:phosphoribosylformimino-5-aminoimidazole carboxamide ribotide isomerase